MMTCKKNKDGMCGIDQYLVKCTKDCWRIVQDSLPHWLVEEQKDLFV